MTHPTPSQGTLLSYQSVCKVDSNGLMHPHKGLMVETLGLKMVLRVSWVESATWLKASTAMQTESKYWQSAGTPCRADFDHLTRPTPHPPFQSTEESRCYVWRSVVEARWSSWSNAGPAPLVRRAHLPALVWAEHSTSAWSNDRTLNCWWTQVRCSEEQPCPSSCDQTSCFMGSE